MKPRNKDEAPRGRSDQKDPLKTDQRESIEGGEGSGGGYGRPRLQEQDDSELDAEGIRKGEEEEKFTPKVR